MPSKPTATKRGRRFFKLASPRVDAVPKRTLAAAFRDLAKRSAEGDFRANCRNYYIGLAEHLAKSLGLPCARPAWVPSEDVARKARLPKGTWALDRPEVRTPQFERAQAAAVEAKMAIERAESGDAWGAAFHAALAGQHWREAVAQPWEEIGYAVRQPGKGKSRAGDRRAVVEGALQTFRPAVGRDSPKPAEQRLAHVNAALRKNGLRCFPAVGALRVFCSTYRAGKSR